MIQVPCKGFVYDELEQGLELDPEKFQLIRYKPLVCLASVPLNQSQIWFHAGRDYVQSFATVSWSNSGAFLQNSSRAANLEA
ncbi:MAG: hypothetical protein K2Z81_23990 [Cyanobacteria bacterium]|nr:hypothetical protein [Cyanobacteriota bacterium]